MPQITWRHCAGTQASSGQGWQLAARQSAFVEPPKSMEFADSGERSISLRAMASSERA
jgi:hypothetical protein